MSEDRRDEDERLVKSHLAQLAEHFDSIRIFVTRHDGGDQETMAFTIGEGNFYAQIGQVREWVQSKDEETCEHARREYDEDDGESESD